ncbi:MAG: Gfo/Idh/MocA family oxidoreductase [Ignavibacteriales bacterium]|nr:Gfo/Idh/MocA family oxidoreductase [Ignavibacteriales bacterium]
MLKMAVIGAGHLGSLHAKMLAGIDGVRLTGLFDIDRAKAESVAAELNTEIFRNLDEAVASADAVSVAATTRAHFDIGRTALEAGRHVFIEKPMTESIDQARTLVELAAQKDRKIQVGHIERFNPAILSLEQYQLHPLFIESHRLAQFNPRGTDVAVVLDLMIHDIDLILSLVHSKVTRIDANGVAVVSDSADIANARLQFENGCVANVTASRISQNRMRKMRLFQRDAYISIDFAQGMAEVFRLVDESDVQARSTMLLGKIEQGKRKRVIVYEQPEIREVNALKHELELFAQCIRDDTDPPVTGRDGLQALEVAAEILRAIEAQTVRIS